MRQSPSATIETPSEASVNVLRSFSLALRAMNRSPKTQETYLDSARQFLTFLKDQGMPQSPSGVKREHVEAFLVHLLEDRGLASSTVNNRYRGVQALFKWMLEEGDIQRSPMEKMKPPQITETPPEVLREDQLTRLLAICDKDNDFDSRRDSPLLRIVIDTGGRLAEITHLTVDDVDLELGLLHVLGKGRRPRILSIGKRTARALDRYLRLRSQHREAHIPALWLGRGGGQRHGAAMTTSGSKSTITPGLFLG